MRDDDADAVPRPAARSGALFAPTSVADALVAGDTDGVWSALRVALKDGASYTDFVRSVAPDLVGLSLSHGDQLEAARTVTAGVRSVDGDRAPIFFVGGVPFQDEALTAADVGADAAHADARSALLAFG